MQDASNRTPDPNNFVDKILGAARASAVFSEPVTTGAYTIVTASEVTAGGGFGSGYGSDAAHPASAGGGSGGGGDPAAGLSR